MTPVTQQNLIGVPMTWNVPSHHEAATVTTTAESRVLIIGAQQFSDAIQRLPRFARRVLREVSLRLRSLDQSLVAS